MQNIKQEMIRAKEFLPQFDEAVVVGPALRVLVTQAWRTLSIGESKRARFWHGG